MFHPRRAPRITRGQSYAVLACALIGAGLLGRYPLASAKAQQVLTTRAMAPASSPYLPDALSPTYQIALRKNPAFTAKLFLQAYEDVAASGPVTSDAVQAYVQRQIASGPQPARGGIVSAKLNTEGFITRLDVKLGGATPKPLGAIFEFSAAQEALMSFEESVAFGQELFSAQPEENIFPIESYLMLFDLDGDGTVAREEVERALTGFMREARQVTRFEEVGEDLRR